MKITTYVPLTRGQDALLDDFNKIEVRPINKTTAIATVKTFLQQKIEITINSEGIVEHVEIIEV